MPDIAVWSDGARVELPGRLVTDIPGYLAVAAGGVLEAIGLVGGSVVPVIVQICEAGNSLLIDAAAVGVHGRHVRIIKFDKV